MRGGSPTCVLTLYVRPGCHLCEDMWSQLEELRRSFRFDVNTVDINDSPILEEAYGRRIPVLEADGVELCGFYLDQQALLNHLDRCGSAAS